MNPIDTIKHEEIQKRRKTWPDSRKIIDNKKKVKNQKKERDRLAERSGSDLCIHKRAEHHP